MQAGKLFNRQYIRSMDQTELLVESIIEGLQEKKGKNIVTVDLNQTTGAICQYMVICEGNTPTQVAASPIPFGISPTRKRKRNRSLLTDNMAPAGLEWTMARFLFIFSCRSSGRSITWNTFGPTRRYQSFRTLTDPVFTFYYRFISYGKQEEHV